MLIKKQLLYTLKLLHNQNVRIMFSSVQPQLNGNENDILTHKVEKITNNFLCNFQKQSMITFNPIPNKNINTHNYKVYLYEPRNPPQLV